MKGGTHKYLCLTESPAIWLYNSGYYLPINARPTGKKNLIIQNVETSNKGYYECEGTNKNGEIFLSEALLKVMGEFTLKVDY